MMLFRKILLSLCPKSETTMTKKDNKDIGLADFPEEVTEEGVMIYGETSYENQMAVMSHYLHNHRQETGEEEREEIIAAVREFLERKQFREEKDEVLSDEEVWRVAESPLQYNLFDDFFNVPFPAPENPRFTFIDLFAGMGGFRIAMQQLGGKCVYSSEFKAAAQKAYLANYGEMPFGDITKESTKRYIPDRFDILCAGFPCQAFSAAGARKGFADETRGTLFFEVAQILKEKRPKGFFLENVEGLVNHDGGRTFRIIIDTLRSIGYHVSHKVLDASDFGVAQARRRIYIVGTLCGKVSLDDFPAKKAKVGDVLEQDKPLSQNRIVKLLLKRYSLEELYGKSIKDKRGGSDNIHSWEIGIKGETTKAERALLDMMLTERRKKKWAEQWGIDWMDGMPLSREMIASFYHGKDLNKLLDSLVKKRYLVYEHPKKRITKKTDSGASYSVRVEDESKPQGYNIVAGKLSFDISKILDPDDVAPTLVAMDMNKLFVGDNGGLRRLTLREGLRLFGYPEEYVLCMSEREGYDLLGNTVVVPVINAVAERLINEISNQNNNG